MTNKSPRMPAIFIGHGSPMNAITETRYSRAWRELGRSLPRPKAILAISAHWYIASCAVTAMDEPRTIHDFGGFPQELFEVEYPAPGSPALATQVCELLQPLGVELNASWGLDHGTWSVLAHVFPDADIPIVQLSIDRRQPAQFHYDLGRRLSALRDEGILLLGSGNIVHNLALLNWDNPEVACAWAMRIESGVRQHLLQREHAPLIDYPHLDPQAQLAIPTAEHYLPLLYIIGSQRDDESVSIPVEGIDMGSLSMLSAVVGNNLA